MPDVFDVRLTTRAKKDLGRLDTVARRRVLGALELLSSYPRPPTSRTLTGRPEYLRIRVGDYRVIYTVDDGKLLVLVITLGHRRQIYRNLP